MEQAQVVNKSTHRISNGMILGVLLICILTFVLNLFGVDFGRPNTWEIPHRSSY